MNPMHSSNTRVSLEAEDVLCLRPEAQLVALADGGQLVRHREGSVVLRGMAADLLARLCPQVDGRRTVGALEQLFSDEPIRMLLVHFFGKLFEKSAEMVPPKSRVLVVGEGELARRLRQDFAAATNPARPLSPADLVGAEMLVFALEEAPYRELFVLQSNSLAAAVPSLFVTAEPEGVRIGPLTLPGLSPCFGCSLVETLKPLGLTLKSILVDNGNFAAGKVPTEHLARAVEIVVAEAQKVLDSQGAPQLLDQDLLLSGVGEQFCAVERLPECPLCAELKLEDASPSRAARVERNRTEALENPLPQAAEPLGEGLVRSVGILGGGTAGYLTALALRRRFPHLPVALIESKDVPIIGVGEATTPSLPQFLHVDLGLDAASMFYEVLPTLKLGIRFLWGWPGEGVFNYPFGSIFPLEPLVYQGDPNTISLQSLMMTAGTVPIYQEGDQWVSRLGPSVAYHLDNERFVAWLKRHAVLAGVERIEATIVDVECSENGAEVTALIDEEGRRFCHDLWVDASGFRSMLLEKTLGSPWISYAGNLFTDRALVATAPHGGVINPYTTARTMSGGWCWSTPQADADHRGYVFSSEFQSPDEAEAEMRRVNPGMGDARMVFFRSGRHGDFWRGNVVALGNAYGFVEPLESTALHMLILQIGELLEAFPWRRRERGLQTILNRKVAGWWDYLQWFLALHFRYNRRLDTPFWHACAKEIDLSSHAELLEAFHERGPLSYNSSLVSAFDYPDPLLWGPVGIDVILLGQGIWGHLPTPAQSRAGWEKQARRAQRVANGATQHARALEVLAERPDLLQDFAKE